MCWLSWFSGLGFCSCPGFHLGLGASDCSPSLAFCFMGPWTFAWICCPQLPYHHPCKNGTHSTCFYSTGGHGPTFPVHWLRHISNSEPPRDVTVQWRRASLLNRTLWHLTCSTAMSRKRITKLLTLQPQPPVFAFLISLLFFFSDFPDFPCFEGAFFLPFPSILGVPRRDKFNPCLFRGFPCFFLFFKWKRGKGPHPQDFSLTKKRLVLLRAYFVLSKDRKRPYYRHFCGKMHKEGSCSKAAGGP